MAAFSTPVQQPRMLPKCWGHRGASASHPENTLASFEQAIQDGADGIESDVHVSQDGVLVMFHDPALDRTTDGVGRIAHTDYYGGLDKLRTKEFPQQPIATFHEAMQLISRPENQHVTFNVDIKPENDARRVFALMAGVLADFPNYQTDLAPRIVLGIWHPKFIQPAKEFLPQCYRLCISCGTDLARKHFWGQVDGFSISFASLAAGDGPAFRRDCQQAGYALYVWTVNDRDEMIEASKWQVEAILTDKCSDYLHLRSKMQDDFHAVTKSKRALSSFRKWGNYRIVNSLYIWLEDWRLVQAAGPLAGDA